MYTLVKKQPMLSVVAGFQQKIDYELFKKKH